jgi:hypothetical protein
MRTPGTHRSQRELGVFPVFFIQFAGIVTTGGGALSSFSASVIITMSHVKMPVDLRSRSSVQYQKSRYLTAANASPGAEAPVA